MSIVSRMRGQLPEAMKARDAVRLGFLRYWIAQFTRGDGTELADDEAVKKLRSIAREAKAGPTSFKPEEIELIGEWVPAGLDRAQIREILEPIAETLKGVPKPGAAMGVAMKQLAGKPVEADDVKAVLEEIRA